MNIDCLKWRRQQYQPSPNAATNVNLIDCHQKAAGRTLISLSFTNNIRERGNAVAKPEFVGQIDVGMGRGPEHKHTASIDFLCWMYVMEWLRIGQQ